MPPEPSRFPIPDSQVAILTQWLSVRWTRGEQIRYTRPADAAAWAHVVDLAHNCHLAPLLYGTITAHHSQAFDTLPSFRNAYLLSRAQNLALRVELSNILVDFRNARVPVIVMKEAALSEVLYNDIGLRPVTNLDILVHESDLETSSNLLEARGYEWTSDALRPPKMRLSSKVSFTKMAAPHTRIDLHWNLFDTIPYRLKSDSDWVWNHTVPFCNNEAMTLGWNAQFLHLCGDFAGHLQLDYDKYQHPEQALLRYCDMAELLYRHSAELDWNVVLSKARELGLLICIQDSVRTIHTVWPQVISSDLLHRILSAQPTTKEQFRYRIRQWGQKSSVHRFAANLMLFPL